MQTNLCGVGRELLLLRLLLDVYPGVLVIGIALAVVGKVLLDDGVAWLLKFLGRLHVLLPGLLRGSHGAEWASILVRN